MRRAARALSMQTGQRVVVAVGGNALQRRGDRLTIENMLKAAKQMAPAIMAIQAAGNEVVLTHGNGPQVRCVLCQNNRIRRASRTRREQSTRPKTSRNDFDSTELESSKVWLG